MATLIKVKGSGQGGYEFPNGMSWTQSNITSGYFNSVYNANGIWVAGSGSSRGLYYSTDGKNWTQSNIISNNFNSVYNANGIWVAGSGSSRGLYYSTDGKSWAQSNITSGNFYSVYNANGIWVATGDSGLYYSPTWELAIVGAVSLNPSTGVDYTDGISDVSADMVSYISTCISKNADVTNETNTIYYDDKQNHYKISVGNQVTIPLNGTDYAFDIIGFNHDDLSDGSGKAGITFQMHDLFATAYPMNSGETNSGGWKDSDMRTSTMATMKGYLPSNWQTAIKPVNKVSGTGGSSSSGTETVSDSCFLLVEIEIFGSTTYSVSGEGTQYAYYKAGNSKVKNKGGSADIWWERSPRSGNRRDFCAVTTGAGAGSDYANYSYGVAFAFCV